MVNHYSKNFKRKRSKKQEKKRVKLPEIQELVIAKLGSDGDGIASNDVGTFYVKRGLIGEKIMAKPLMSLKNDHYTAFIDELVESSPLRIQADCEYYEKCGGCAFRHVALSFEEDHKINMLKYALKAHDLEIDITTVDDYPIKMTSVADGSRRRALLSFKYNEFNGSLQVGFMSTSTHKLCDIEHCLSLNAKLNTLVKALKVDLAKIFQASIKGKLYICCPEDSQSQELVIEASREYDRNELIALVDMAHDHKITSFHWQKGAEEPLPILIADTTKVKFENTQVELPPRAFLQPSTAGEILLRQYVIDNLEKYAPNVKKTKVLDLFSGCGTFTIPIASRKYNVCGVEVMESALKSLSLNAGRNQLGGLITTKLADLFKSPLTSKELNKFNAIIIDPPRMGAKDQCQQIADSDVPLIIMISCNPKTMAKDLNILVNGGYEIKHVAAFNQFVKSSHLESAAVLVKG